jgi:pimeloyl-ACP methyl ester carboxylesterase
MKTIHSRSITRNFRWRSVLALAGSGLVLAGATACQAARAADQAASPASLVRFEHQAIAWHACRSAPGDATGAQLKAVGARCGYVRVPLDYRHPDGRTILVAVARRPATDRRHVLGTLVVNTGGPGPSLDGVTAIARGVPGLAPHGEPALAGRYNLVGIDPRFFGLSDPLQCDWPTRLAMLGSIQIATPDRRSFDASVTVARDLASRCARYASVLPFASTRDMARDMDIVRAALGVRKITYLGWSWGTYLGAVYLQMFPRHVGRIVLDSSVDPRVYGPRLTRDLAPADQAALRNWAAWAARHDARYHLGGSAASVLRTVWTIHDAARRRPLQVGPYHVSADMLPGLLLTAQDTRAANAAFSAEVSELRAAASGHAVTPTGSLAAKLALFEDPAVLPELWLSATTATQCADRAAPRNPLVYYRDIRRHLAREPFYGPLFRHLTPCAFWPITPVAPPAIINNNHPVLMVGATGDPAAPYSGQLVLHRELHGSRLVTLENRFIHGVYELAGSKCVDDIVNRYLLGGPLPGRDVSCRRG